MFSKFSSYTAKERERAEQVLKVTQKLQWIFYIRIFFCGEKKGAKKYTNIDLNFKRRCNKCSSGC